MKKKAGDEVARPGCLMLAAISGPQQSTEVCLKACWINSSLRKKAANLASEATGLPLHSPKENWHSTSAMCFFENRTAPPAVTRWGRLPNRPRAATTKGPRTVSSGETSLPTPCLQQVLLQIHWSYIFLIRFQDPLRAETNIYFGCFRFFGFFFFFCCCLYCGKNT